MTRDEALRRSEEALRELEESAWDPNTALLLCMLMLSRTTDKTPKEIMAVLRHAVPEFLNDEPINGGTLMQLAQYWAGRAYSRLFKGESKFSKDPFE